MTTATNDEVNRNHFRAKPDSADFFGIHGTKCEVRHWRFWRRTVWRSNFYNELLPGQSATDWQPVDLLPLIDHLFECYEAWGHGACIATLLVGPTDAVQMYLGGLLQLHHLRAAVEQDTYVDIPDVQLVGRNLTVRVVPRIAAMSVLDIMGNPI
ncbi:MAG TPA: hypothetical protein VK694_08195 [Verrucomicrobiae bacterium]|nr:hypothetical protein [Verrucomicrobiae bacterium]